MLFIVLTTGKCNLRCIYCGGSFPPEVVPWEVKYPVEALVRFLEEDHEPIVCFYGGEPLLNPRFIEEVMDRVDWARFVIQTNGLLVDVLPAEYWRRFDAVLLSIDGRREVTDFYRGRGVYDAVLRAARKLRSAGFEGDLIARMCVSEESDIYAEVTHLLSLGLFDHVHWQLDVVWSDRWKDFDKWAETVYKPGLNKLAEFWVRELSRGRVHGIAPFQAVAHALVTNGRLPSPPCEAGVNAYAVSTDGRILACPIAVYERWAEVGHVEVDSPKTLKKVRIGEPCTSCDLYPICGGRCLYAYMERLWGEEGFRKVCSLARFFINCIAKRLSIIREAVRSGVISLEDLNYPKFNNSIEIIP